MKVLTVRQPWADRFFLPTAAKDIENRPMRTRVKGRIGIHAGKLWHDSATDQDRQNPHILRGVVLGTVQLVGSHQEGSAECRLLGCHENPWAMFALPGCPPIWHWEVEHPREFITPIKATGALGFWTPGPSLEHLMSIAELAL